jgi:hypothetical protein
MFKFYQVFSGVHVNLIEPKLLKNPTKILIEFKHYMNPIKNPIEPKLYMNSTKNLIERF